MSNRLVITRLVRKLFSTVYSTMDSLSVRSVNVEKGTRAAVVLNLYLKLRCDLLRVIMTSYMNIGKEKRRLIASGG